MDGHPILDCLRREIKTSIPGYNTSITSFLLVDWADTYIPVQLLNCIDPVIEYKRRLGELDQVACKIPLTPIKLTDEYLHMLTKDWKV